MPRTASLYLDEDVSRAYSLYSIGSLPGDDTEVDIAALAETWKLLVAAGRESELYYKPPPPRSETFAAALGLKAKFHPMQYYRSSAFMFKSAELNEGKLPYDCFAGGHRNGLLYDPINRAIRFRRLTNEPLDSVSHAQALSAPSKRKATDAVNGENKRNKSLSHQCASESGFFGDDEEGFFGAQPAIPPNGVFPKEVRNIIFSHVLGSLDMGDPRLLSTGRILSTSSSPTTSKAINILALNKQIHEEVSELLYAQRTLVVYVTADGIFTGAAEAQTKPSDWQNKFEDNRSYWNFATKVEVQILAKAFEPGTQQDRNLLANISYLCNRLNTLYLPMMEDLQIKILFDAQETTTGTRLEHLQHYLTSFHDVTLIPNKKGQLASLSFHVDTEADGDERFLSNYLLSKIMNKMYHLPVFDDENNAKLQNLKADDHDMYMKQLKMIAADNSFWMV